MNNKLKILICAILVIALIGIVYAGGGASQNAPGQMKKPPKTTVPTTIPTTVPTTIPTTVPTTIPTIIPTVTPTPTPTIPPIDITLYDSSINPMLNKNIPLHQVWENGMAEPNIIQDPNNIQKIDFWYGDYSGKVGYASSTDYRMEQWTKYSGNPLTFIGGSTGQKYYPYIVWDQFTSKWYMFTNDASTVKGTTVSGDIYLWNSTDKINWYAMNNGEPVLRQLTNPATTGYMIWNIAVKPVSSDRWEMLIEAGNSTRGCSAPKIITAYSNLEEMNWSAHLSSTAVIWGGANPDFVYIPEDNAVAIIYMGVFPGIRTLCPDPLAVEEFGGSNTGLKAAYRKLDAPIDDPASYTLVPLSRFSVAIPNHIIGDVSIGTPADKNWDTVLAYTHGQCGAYDDGIAFSYYNLTSHQFYENVLGGS